MVLSFLEARLSTPLPLPIRLPIRLLATLSARECSLETSPVRFGVVQWDLGTHRDFHIWESIMLQFRAEMFNVFNHSNSVRPVLDSV